jgi:hypothetical protein
VVRMLVRGASVVMVFFVAVMSVALIQEDESSFPLGTSQAFVVSVARSESAKEDLIRGLDQVADSTGAILVKLTANLDDPTGGRDLVWFGSRPPVADAELGWFDPSLGGRLVASSELGQRPLDGYYALSDCARCRTALVEWAEANGVSLDSQQTRSARGLVAGLLTSSGAGFALVSVVVLLVSVVMTWFSARARSRSLRLLGGVSRWRIHAWDIWSLARTILVWSALGWVLSCAVVAAQRGVDRLGVFATWSASILAVIDVVIVAVCAAVSWVTRPTVAALATRRPPLVAFRRMGVAVRFVAVLVAAAVLPFTVHFAQAARSAQVEAARWVDARGAVTVTMSSVIDTTGLDKYLPGLTSFAERVDQEGISALSFTVDQALNMTPEELGPFDHVIITDPAFLSLMQIGTNDAGPQSGLTPVSEADIPAALHQTLAGQLEIWTTERTAAPHGIGYYTYSGDESFAAIGSTLTGGATVQAKHPLVVLVDHPLTTFKTEGFTLSMMVNGNLVFTDADRLRTLLHDNELTPLVTSIDDVADETLAAAQVYGQQAQLGVLATALAALALLVALVQAAQIWAGTNQRRIFTLHSSGRSYWSIQSRRTALEAVFIVVACAAAAAVSAAGYHATTSQMLLVLVPIIPAYLVGGAVAHRVAARAAFTLSLHRRA